MQHYMACAPILHPSRIQSEQHGTALRGTIELLPYCHHGGIPHGVCHVRVSVGFVIVFLTRSFIEKETQSLEWKKDHLRRYGTVYWGTQTNMECITHKHCKGTRELFITNTRLEILPFSCAFFPEFAHCLLCVVLSD